MNIFTGKKLFLILAVFVLIFSSCLGLSMDIELNKDGSGKLIMEYRISNMLGGLGALDGNAQYPSIPTGRQDWERTIARIDGAKLSSFSTGEKGQDTIIKVTINFDNPDALLKIIDPAGSSSLNMKGEFNIFLNISDSIDDSDYNDIMSLAGGMFTGYSFSVSFTAPSNSTMTITDAGGKVFSVPSGAQIVSSGKKVSLTMGMKDFLDISNNIVLKYNW